MPPAPHDDLAIRIDNVAVAVPNAVVSADALFFAQRHVVPTHEVNRILDGAGGVVGSNVHEMADQTFLANVVEVRRKDHLRSLKRKQTSRLDIAAVRTN